MTVTVNEDKFIAPNNNTSAIPTIGKTNTATCPRCKNKFCDRIKRGSIVKLLLPWLSVKRYHCTKCNNRFYKRS